MPSEPSDAVRRLAAGTADLQSRGCYDNPPAPPWNYPICILEVTSPAPPAINVFPSENWSGAEEWGLWALERESLIRWVSINREEARFAVEAFPHCIEGVPQQVDFVIADRVVASHRWDDCEPWRDEIAVPSDLVETGWNEIRLRFARADRPADVTNGQNPDVRRLSVGFTRFELLR
jgi:hypothetical protein